MSGVGIDYAWGRPDPEHVAALGYRVVARYLSHDPSKDLTAGELADLLREHVDVVVVWETTANRALSGHPGGLADGQETHRRLAQLHAPAWVAPYAAVDFQPSPAQLPAVLGYFDGFREGVGGRRVGGYGSYRVIRAGFDGKHIDLGWQTRAWSGTPPAIDPRACLYQNARVVRIDGVTCDIDEVRRPDVGGWLSHPALSPMNPSRKRHTMVILRLPWNGAEWLVGLTADGALARMHLSGPQASAFIRAGLQPTDITEQEASALGLH